MFERKCFIKRNQKNLGNLDSGIDEGKLLGYCIRSKGYKCCNKRTMKIEECIDLVVYEVGSQPEHYVSNLNSDNEEIS